MKYYRLTEHNEWEGETWHFYIPVDGNEEELEKLRSSIDGEIYKLSKKTYEEDKITTLCEDDDDAGYMAKHNKLEGKFVFEQPSDKNTEPLYKGGIRKMMK